MGQSNSGALITMQRGCMNDLAMNCLRMLIGLPCCYRAGNGKEDQGSEVPGVLCMDMA